MMNGRNRAPIPPAEDSSSPYFLHPSDNPGTILIPQPLIGSNYSTWSRSFTTTLLAKNKLVFTDRSILRPNGDDLLYQAWIRCNSMVVAWLRNSVSPQICSSIMFLDNAYEIWSDRKDRFSLGDSARLYQLRQQLMTLTQGNSDVSSYFTSLRSVWDEFKNSQPISWCTCNRCTCNSAARWHQQQEDDCTVQFLIGLNSSFSQIRSNILAITPLHSLSKVFSVVIQEERQRRIDGNLISSSHSPTPVISEQPFYNATSSFGRGFNKFLCSHCGKTNHNVDKCLFLHGFPPGYGRDKPKPTGFTQSSSSSYKPSGFAQSSSYKQKSNNCVEDNSDSSHWKGAQNVANLPSMDQYQQLVSLLQSQFPSQSSLTAPDSPHQTLPQSQPAQSYIPFSGTICFSPSVNSLSSSCHGLSTWILDTGATHHVCYDPSLMSSASPIANASVNLPNGQTAPITHIGIVILTPTITLSSVLHVPSFSFNLLSVSALTKHASCTVTFTHNQFHIQ